MSSVEQTDSGEWCVVENGRWFPFSDELTAFHVSNCKWKLFDSDYRFYRNGKSGEETTSKSKEQKATEKAKYDDYLNLSDIEKALASNDPKPAGLGSVGYMTTKYYDKKAIENLKANTSKSINFYTYAPTSFGSPLVAETAPPEPPKKAMPKAVPDTNGRKFRDEE